MKKIVLNHKSYLSYNETQEYIKEIKKINIENFELIIYPSIPYLALYKETGKTLGSQNFYSYNYGSYTGEINLESLKSMGINYTLIGHSERKKHGLDDYTSIKDKVFKSVNANFKTILCVGEEKKQNRPSKYIKKELEYLTKEITYDKIQNLSIAYEPSWAIGSGDVPDVRDIEKCITFIKKYFLKKFNYEVEVYYGGSVNNENVEEIMEITDGVLIGKKSVNIDEIKKIIEIVSKL